MAEPLKLVMIGTKDFALPTLERLCDSRHSVLALVTQPDRPQGRKQELVPARVKVFAQSRGVPVFQPESINGPEGLAILSDLRPDLLVTAAYGQILSAEVLTVPPLGGINLHGSILPRYRGAAPVARAIQAGEQETGITVIAMTPRVDAGGMISVATTPIQPDETAGELEARLAILGAPLVLDAVERLASGEARVLPQDPSKATRAPKLRKDEGVIDWARSAQQIHDLVRAMQPWPTASTSWRPAASDRPPSPLIVHRTTVEEGRGEPGLVLESTPQRLLVATGDGAVALRSVQVPGKKALSGPEFARGYRVGPGDRFGGSPAD